MDIVSFFFGFITALVFIGILTLAGVAWWFFSYSKYKSKQQLTPKGKPIKVAKRPPYISETDMFN